MREMKIHRVFGKIWIGPGDDVRAICSKFMDPDSVQFDLPIHKGPAGYAILNVADDYPEYLHPRDMLFIHAGLNDGPEDWSQPYGEDNSLYAYLHAIRSLYFLEHGLWEVLVHCYAGVSRSSFVVAMYMAHVLDVPYNQAKEMLYKLHHRANIHPKHERYADELLDILSAGVI